MTKTWTYTQPVEILFQNGIANKIDDLLQQRGFTKGILVCDEFFADAWANVSPKFTAVFSDIQPNPTIENVQNCTNAIVASKAEFVVALGGGSAIDCAKIAAALAKSNQNAAKVHAGLESLAGTSLPLIAIPTTAGTGSEVTPVSVITDAAAGKKSSVVHPCLFPKLAVIDPNLCLSMPPNLTAVTGLDALAHALEAFWSKNHQPICDALALEASRKVFEYLPTAFKDGKNIKARAEMCEASVLAGMAFALPRTAGSHACSYAFTSAYDIPHGEACALTLAAFTRINCEAEEGRLHNFAKQLGFKDAYAMADSIDELKKLTGMKMTLGEFGVTKETIPMLVEESKHPNLLNNPVNMDDKRLSEMFESLL